MGRAQLLIEPIGWACRLADCPPGLFCESGTDADPNRLGFKAAHALLEGDTFDMHPIAYWLATGEFWTEARGSPLSGDEYVQPCRVRYEEKEGA